MTLSSSATSITEIRYLDLKARPLPVVARGNLTSSHGRLDKVKAYTTSVATLSMASRPEHITLQELFARIIFRGNHAEITQPRASNVSSPGLNENADGVLVPSNK